MPLLYATSTGAPYERFEYDVDAPTGRRATPGAHVRLYAGSGSTEVSAALPVGSRSERPAGAEPTSAAAPPRTARTVVEPYRVGPTVLPVRRALDRPRSGRPDAFWSILDDGDGRATVDDEALLVVLDPLPPSGQCAVGSLPVPADEFSARSSPTRTCR